MLDTDATSPNLAGIYDCLLDGPLHTPADRAAAEALLHIFPDAAQVTRLYRYVAQWSAQALAKEGFGAYLDLATGFPPEPALHELVPPSTKILYNDRDPETVALTHELVAAQPDIRCRQGDLRAMDVLLADADVFFAGERCVGISLVNVSWEIDDQALAHVFRQLYSWSLPGSLIAVSGFALDPLDPLDQQVQGWFDALHLACFPRSADQFLALAAPWQVMGTLAPIESYAETGLRHLQVDLLPSPALASRRGRLGYAGLLRHP